MIDIRKDLVTLTIKNLEGYFSNNNIPLMISDIMHSGVVNIKDSFIDEISHDEGFWIENRYDLFNPEYHDDWLGPSFEEYDFRDVKKGMIILESRYFRNSGLKEKLIIDVKKGVKYGDIKPFRIVITSMVDNKNINSLLKGNTDVIKYNREDYKYQHPTLLKILGFSPKERSNLEELIPTGLFIGGEAYSIQ